MSTKSFADPAITDRSFDAAVPSLTSGDLVETLPSTVHALCNTIIQALDTNKAEDITLISLIGKSSFADGMIIASGRSPRHVAALTDYVEKALKEMGQPVLSVEGKQTGDWVLVDTGDIVIHLFRPEVRSFYNLEKMWSVPAVEPEQAKH